MYTSKLRNRHLHLQIIAVLMVLIYAITALFSSGSVNLAGEIVDRKEVNIAILKTLFISIPIMGFLLGAAFALIPYKSWAYNHRFLRASILTILVINAIMLLNVLYRTLLM